MPLAIRRLLRGDFVRHGLLIFASTLLVNAGNYGFHFVASRRAGTAGYGDLYALITALALLSVLTTSATTVVVRLTAELNAVGDVRALGSLHHVARRWSLLAGAVFAVAALALGAAVVSFLRLGDASLVLPWALVIAGSVVVPPVRGLLQGLQDFRAFAISTLVEAAGKVVLGAGALLVGFGPRGALFGQALGMFAAWVYIEVCVRRRLGTAAREHFVFDWRRFRIIAGGVIVSILGGTALASIDPLLAKHYLGPHDAGLFSAVSLSGKVLLFVVGFVPMVLLPKATDAAMRGEPVRPLIASGAALTLGLTGCVLALYALAPGAVLRAMVGASYATATPYVLTYACAMAVLALTNTVIAFNIAVHRFGFVAPLIGVVAAEVIAIARFHGDILQIVLVVLIAQIAGALACMIPWHLLAAARQVLATERAAR